MADDLIPGQHVVLSGCSSGGKSTLIMELARKGFRTVPEPGRRIIEEEMRVGGAAFPWVDPAAFSRRAIEMARRDRQVRDVCAGWIFYDRGLIDAAVALQHATGESAAVVLGQSERYHRQVFMAPPWPEIFSMDSNRRHGLADALAEYERLLAAYLEFGYETILLPKVGIAERADFVLHHLR